MHHNVEGKVYVIDSFQVDMSLVHLFAEVNVPVVGGHAGITILPLFSQVLSLLLNLTHGPSKYISNFFM